jgi:hypothetical protein
MTMNQSTLINDLVIRTKENILKATSLLKLPYETLNTKANKDAWSALECIEHLNLYNDFYLPELSRAIYNATPESIENFKSGWLGNYFANSMLPKDRLNKMKTFKDKNPNGSKLSIDVIQTFISAQTSLLQLLDRCQNINLTKIKTGISISKWIKLRLGDTLRVVIYHNERHLLQAQKSIILK